MASEISFRSNKIIAKINKALHKKILQQLHIQITDRLKDLSFPSSEQSKEKPQINTTEREQIQGLLSKIEDSELQQILRQIFREAIIASKR